MVQTLDSFSTLLPMITRVFLLEHETGSHVNDLAKVQKAAEAHQNSFTNLQKNLREAKSEWALTRSDLNSAQSYGPDNPISGHRSYEDAVDSLNRLAQHLNGLRSGISVQYELVKASRDGRLQLPKQPTGRTRTRANTTATLNGNGKGKAVDTNGTTTADGTHDDDTALLQAAADAFGDVIDDLGPPLKALSVSHRFC